MIMTRGWPHSSSLGALYYIFKFLSALGIGNAIARDLAAFSQCLEWGRAIPFTRIVTCDVVEARTGKPFHIANTVNNADHVKNPTSP